MEAAAAAHAELARRVAQADLMQLHGVRISELQAMVDGFMTADRQFLQLPGGGARGHRPCCLRLHFNAGMAAWERGFVHEYAGGKGLHHPTTEARSRCRCAPLFFDGFGFSHYTVAGITRRPSHYSCQGIVSLFPNCLFLCLWARITAHVSPAYAHSRPTAGCGLVCQRSISPSCICCC